MNIYSHQFSWQLNFLQIFLRVNTQTVSKKKKKKIGFSHKQENTYRLFILQPYVQISPRIKALLCSNLDSQREKSPISWRSQCKCTKQMPGHCLNFRQGTDVQPLLSEIPCLHNVQIHILFKSVLGTFQCIDFWLYPLPHLQATHYPL